MSNIHGLNTDDDKPPRRGDGGSSGNESDDDEGRQGFFVGGSERSGQQVLGPNQNDHQNRIFDAIRRAGAEQMTPEQMEEMERQKQQRGGTSAWGGGGFRLGGHGIASEPVGSSAANSAGNSTANGPAQRPQQVVRMFIWRNGFSIDDGPLRQFEDNRAFMDALMKKRIPPELNALYPGKEIDLRIERKAEDYVPPKPKPFSGQGHRLGSHVPNVVGVGNSSAAATGVDIVDLEPTPPLKPPSDSLVEEAQKNVQLNEQQPITRIQIRFPDLPQPIVARFNHTATLDQLRAFIVTVQPTLAFRPFHLQTIYPHKLIEDESQSLEEAKLINAAVTLKFDD